MGWSKRLDTLLIDYLRADDTSMVRTYTRKWAISAVARAYDWGCKVDTMLILKGLQGAGKSTFFKPLQGPAHVLVNHSSVMHLLTFDRSMG
jgi:putative DNA primase/helicase